MEMNTVYLDVETYNRLRDFKREIETGNTIYVKNRNSRSDETYISTDEAVKQITDVNSELIKIIENATKTINDLKYEYKDFNLISNRNSELLNKIKNLEEENKALKTSSSVKLINDLKGMSFWKLYNWHKSNK